jgi:hypothetical protein
LRFAFGFFAQARNARASACARDVVLFFGLTVLEAGATSVDTRSPGPSKMALAGVVSLGGEGGF